MGTAFTVDWQSHLEAFPCATWIGDSDGGNTYVNLAYRRLLGVVSLQLVTGRGWEQYVHPEDQADYVAAWDHFVEGLSERFEQNVRWIRPDTGDTISIAVRAQRVAGNKFQGWVRPSHAEHALARLEEVSHGRKL